MGSCKEIDIAKAILDFDLDEDDLYRYGSESEKNDLESQWCNDHLLYRKILMAMNPNYTPEDLTDESVKSYEDTQYLYQIDAIIFGISARSWDRAAMFIGRRLGLTDDESTLLAEGVWMSLENEYTRDEWVSIRAKLAETAMRDEL
jgi:hypothetical protein